MSNEDLLTVRQAIKDVHIERKRQELVEGWSPEHDDEHDAGDLSAAACCYVMAATDLLNPYSQGDGGYHLPGDPPEPWPMNWEASWWKPGEPRRMLVKAAALIIAEIERIDRKEPSNGE